MEPFRTDLTRSPASGNILGIPTRGPRPVQVERPLRQSECEVMKGVMRSKEFCLSCRIVFRRFGCEPEAQPAASARLHRVPLPGRLIAADVQER